MARRVRGEAMPVRQSLYIIASTIAAVAAVSSHDADAFQRRQGALGCMFDPTQLPNFTVSREWRIAGNQLQWLSDNAAIYGRLYCALPDDDLAPVRSLAWISFQGYDGNTNSGDITPGSLLATPCFTFESGGHVAGG